MISELLKNVMREHSLKQADLAEVLEVSLSRVKSMTSGRVKNLTREESELLIGKLGIRAAWLVTGEGPMHEDLRNSGAEGILSAIEGGLYDPEASAPDAGIRAGLRDMAARKQAQRKPLSHAESEEALLLAAFRAADAPGRAAVLLAAQGIAALASSKAT